MYEQGCSWHPRHLNLLSNLVVDDAKLKGKSTDT